MEIKVRDIHDVHGKGNLHAFANVECGPFTIRSCRIIRQPGQRAYVALPQSKAKDGRFYPIIQCEGQDLKRDIELAVLRRWKQKDA